ncbi:MAG: Rubrerythrin [Firmicutes bacterium ADurb.Bin419]|nr:MAG: Rubrerythrin [Firmicutes bacterium ADurb.Bin419]
MENTIVNELNTVLKGEIMAIESYDKYIRELKDGKIRNVFLEIQDDHKEHVNLLEDRIKQLGGEPDEKLGVPGFMANAKMTLKNMGETKAIDLLKWAYDGEDKGIAMVEEIVKGDLDDTSMKLVKEILSVDHDHLKTMNSLIAEQEKTN